MRSISVSGDDPWVPARAELVLGPRKARTRALGRDDRQRCRVGSASMTALADTAPSRSFSGRLSTYFYLRPRLLLALFLLPPLLWLGVVYLGSLFALLAQSFFQLDDFTGQVVYKPT